MGIEINSDLKNDEYSQENDVDGENNAENKDDKNDIDQWSLAKKVFQEIKISLTEKANMKFSLFCDLLEKCLKQKGKVKSQ